MKIFYIMPSFILLNIYFVLPFLGVKAQKSKPQTPSSSSKLKTACDPVNQSPSIAINVLAISNYQGSH